MKCINSVWYYEPTDEKREYSTFSAMGVPEPIWDHAKFSAYHALYKCGKEIAAFPDGGEAYFRVWAIAALTLKWEPIPMTGHVVGELMYLLRAGLVEGPHPREYRDGEGFCAEYLLTERGIAEAKRLAAMSRSEAFAECNSYLPDRS